MADNRFTFAVQRLPGGPSYTESFQDQNSYELIFVILLFLLIFENLLEIEHIHVMMVVVVVV